MQKCRISEIRVDEHSSAGSPHPTLLAGAAGELNPAAVYYKILYIHLQLQQCNLSSEFNWAELLEQHCQHQDVVMFPAK